MRKLPKPRFNLKAPQAKTETLIFLVFRYNGKKLLYSTGLNVHPKDWDTKAQRPIEKRDRKDLLLLYRQVNNLAIQCKDIFIASNYGDISVTEFKDKLDRKDAEKEASVEKPIEEPEFKRPEFLEFLDLELAEMKATGMKSETYRGFKLHANLLKKFSRKHGYFTYEDVDWALRLKLIDWLTGRNMQLSYANKTLKVLRMFLERARKKKLHSNTDYQGRGWMVAQTRAKGHTVYLNPQELQTLADLQLFGICDKVRDLFLIGAATGQRFSDYSKYTQNDFYTSIQGVPLLSIVSQKTHMPAKIPLNIFPWLIPILEKHNYASPKVSLPKLNEWIKEICLKAGFTNKVLKIEQYMCRKPTVVKSYAPKYKQIASHTCRRSFATNLYKMGYRISQIMPMTGHATETQLREYIGIDNEQNAEEIGLAFLNQPNHIHQIQAMNFKKASN